MGSGGLILILSKTLLFALAAGAVVASGAGVAVAQKNKATKAKLKVSGPCPSGITQDQFVARLEQAIATAKSKGAKLNKKAVIAQAALETGWGKHIPTGEGLCSNNLFGITKGSTWLGPTVRANNRDWRVYASWSDCLVDYSKVIARLYPQCLPFADPPKGNGDSAAWIKGLVSGKYKWTPDAGYTDNVIAVSRGLDRRLA